MKEEIMGRIRMLLFDSQEEAQKAAGQEVAATAGFSVPVIVFRQGLRTCMSGALPFTFIETRLESKPAKKRASIEDTSVDTNRPLIPEHAEAISKYIMDNRDKNYILPPMTLNVQEDTNLYSFVTSALMRPGYLVIPATAKLAITDGQHRRKGINEALERLPSDQQKKLAADSIAVMITCETDIDQIHQDFADCSRTKPLPPSQLAVYDRRNPANKVVLDLERNCKLFRGKIDAVSKNMGKNSTSLFLANHLRQLVKTLLTGNWQASDADFQKRATDILNGDSYGSVLDKYVEYLNFLTELVPVWKEISMLKSGMSLNIIPEKRAEGYVCMSVVGLVIIGNIGYHLFTKYESEWKDYAERLARIDWKKSGVLWRDNVVKDGKIINQQAHVRTATNKVAEAIGLPIKNKQGALLEENTASVIETSKQ